MGTKSVSPAPLPRLSAPAQRAINAHRIYDLHDISRFSEKEIAALHGIGGSTLTALKGAMKKTGIRFRK
jgi:hypothetical protein